MRLEFLGHAGFEILLKLGHRIVIDPWLTGNPVVKKSITDIAKVDYVLLSHSHRDHGIEDAIEICRRDNAKFVGIVELADHVASKGVISCLAANIGSLVDVGNDIGIALTPAVHTTAFGMPVGYIISAEQHNIWYMGDTAFVSDAEYYSKKFKIDTLILPVGGRFTMDFYDALQTIKLVQPQVVVPCHYDTFPDIAVKIDEFKQFIEAETYAKVLIMNPGDLISL